MTAPAITNLINYSFSSCEFAQIWKQAVVVPYKKSAKSEQPTDTRPKLHFCLERSAHAQPTEYLNSKKNISPYQLGNRKIHSTETALGHETSFHCCAAGYVKGV